MTLTLKGRLVLVGAGRMGGAMLEGWLSRGIEPANIVVSDPNPSPGVVALIDQRGLAHNPPLERVEDVQVVLIAVKPQMMDDVLPTLKPLARMAPLFVSVAAGTPIAVFERHFGTGSAVVRSMPNTPAAIGRGITVICPNGNVTEAQAELAISLLSAIGDVGRVDDEALMDAVTGVSGSGPAYVFYLTECLAEAGIRQGLSEDLAVKLARATVAGSGELMRVTNTPAGILRENVTSPNGTTAAALEVLMAADGLGPLMDRAVAAARQRSRELAG